MEAPASLLRAEIGWAPAETFESGLERTVRWYLDNPEWIAGVQSGDYRRWIAQHYEAAAAGAGAA